MIDIYVLDKDLNAIGIIDAYKSLIWINRYNEAGACELYLAATSDNLSLLKNGNYLIRTDDEMICRIRRIELDTNATEGNYLIVNGDDAKQILDQRILWGTATWYDTKVETIIRRMVQRALITASLSTRRLLKSNGEPLLQLGNLANFSETMTVEMSYKNIGETIREYCNKYGWGYKIVFNDNTLWFQLYKGTDRSNEVIFSDDYENLSFAKYTDDKTNMGNVALIGGQGQGAQRSLTAYGDAEGVDRYEQFVDAKDIPKTTTWAELTSTYPTITQGGQGYISGDETSGYTYNIRYMNIPIIDSNQLAWLKINYPTGQEITVDGNKYYRVYHEAIADLPTNAPVNDTQVTLRNLIYYISLLMRGAEKLAEFGEVVSFEGEVIPNVSFIYKQDYFLGDIVTIENEYGIRVAARLVEVTEVSDETGYNMEPKFEYMEVL